jgi:hypothetical protein
LEIKDFLPEELKKLLDIEISEISSDYLLSLLVNIIKI